MVSTQIQRRARSVFTHLREGPVPFVTSHRAKFLDICVLASNRCKRVRFSQFEAVSSTVRKILQSHFCIMGPSNEPRVCLEAKERPR